MELNYDDGNRFLLERMDAFRIASEAKVVRTFQNVRLFSSMSALENLVIAQHEQTKAADVVLGLFGGGAKSTRDQIERARYWLDRMGLLAGAREPARPPPIGSPRPPQSPAPLW